jgi:anti-sigma B factor antagonist
MLRARLETSGDALVVTVFCRRLDARSAPDFLAAVQDQVRGRRVVVVSLAHVAEVDASGLAALVATLKLMPPGATLRLAQARPAVRALLEATLLDEVLPAFEDPAAALQA